MPQTKKMSSHVQKPFPLLKLPAEIRIRICKYVVVKDVMVPVWEFVRDGKFQRNIFATDELNFHHEVDERRRSSWLAVAFTCRQLYLKVTPIYYGENIFRIYGSRLDYEIFERFTAAIGPRITSTITEIGLYETCWPIDRYLAKLPGLKHLHSMDFGAVEWQNRLTALAQKHASLTMVHGGKVWGPEQWRLYPGDESFPW